MNINIETKFNRGDVVWVVLGDWYDLDNDCWVGNPKRGVVVDMMLDDSLLGISLINDAYRIEPKYDVDCDDGTTAICSKNGYDYIFKTKEEADGFVKNSDEF